MHQSLSAEKHAQQCTHEYRGGPSTDDNPDSGQKDVNQNNPNSSGISGLGLGGLSLADVHMVTASDGEDFETAVECTEVAFSKPFGRGRPRSSSFRGSYAEPDSDPELVTLDSSSQGSQEELEILFENVGNDSGHHDETLPADDPLAGEVEVIEVSHNQFQTMLPVVLVIRVL